MKPSRIFDVYEQKKGKRTILFTKSFVKGKLFYGENIVGNEYREWEPRRSKLAAAIMKGSPNIAIRKGDVVLYLGVAHGYTASFVSDIVGKEGFVFAVDFAPLVIRDTVFVAEARKNIAPILADANKPEGYIGNVTQVDVVYQDIAQRNQLEIFLKNCELFLKKGGYALLAVKARSIDVAKKPKQIFKDVQKQLEKSLTIIDYRNLEPFEKDHCMFICKKG